MATANYPKLSKVASKDEYLALQGKKAKLGRNVVTVSSIDTESRQGSYERGLKWSRSKWGMLIRGKSKYSYQYSTDHGVTWHYDKFTARKSKGRTKLSGYVQKEFAFDRIQELNHRDFGPGFKWTP